MDKTQLYIIRQSSAKTAFEFVGQAIKCSDERYRGLTTKDAFALAKAIERYVITGE